MLRKRNPGCPCCCALSISAVCFRVLCVETFPGEGLEPECENAFRVTAVVTSVYHGSQVDVDDEITVWDTRHAHFDLPIEDLIGAVGTAVYHHVPEQTDWGTIEASCQEYDILDGDTCRWVVTSMKECDDRTKDDIVFRVLSNAPIVRTQITDGSSEYDEIDYGLRVWAEVIEVACGNTAVVSVWDKIIVWDLDFDKFDLPLPVLLGAIGTARRIVDPLPWEDPYCTEHDGECRWIATGIVCCEELYACD